MKSKKQAENTQIQFILAIIQSTCFASIASSGLNRPAKTSKNTCYFWDLRKFTLGFTMVVYEKIDLEA